MDAANPPALSEPALNPALPIIDAHHHFWYSPPVAGYPPYPIAAFADDLIGTGHNFIGSVYTDSLVGYRTSGPEHLKFVGEVEQVERDLSAFRAKRSMPAGFCGAIVGHGDMLLGEAAGEALDAFMEASPRFRGIRHMTAFAEELPLAYGGFEAGTLLRPSFLEGLKQLESRGLVFEAWMFQEQLPELLEIARKLTRLSIVLNHTGGPRSNGCYEGRADEAFDEWRQNMRALAAFPNITVKLGGLNMSQTGLTPPGGPAAVTSEAAARLQRAHLLAAIEMFGPDRAMFSSNSPVDTAFIGFGVLWNSFKIVTSDFSEADKEALFSGTVARVYDIPGP
jgi:L-fuconolactonase